MKIKPLGRKILIEMIKEETKIHLPESVDQKPIRCIVKGIGDDVDINIKLEDEVRLFSMAHIDAHKENPNLGLVDQADVWAVIQR